MPLHRVHPRLLKVVTRPRLRDGHQISGSVESTGLDRRRRCRQRALGASRGTEGRIVARSRNAAAADRPPRSRARPADRSNSSATSWSVRVRHWPGATRVDPDRVADRWRSPSAACTSRRSCGSADPRPPSGRGDAETALANRRRRAWPRPRAPQLRRRSPSARRLATAGPDHPRATVAAMTRVAGSGSEGLRSADGSALQYRRQPHGAGKPEPAGELSGSLHETTPAEPTDCPASRRRSI